MKIRAAFAVGEACVQTRQPRISRPRTAVAGLASVPSCPLWRRASARLL